MKMADVDIDPFGNHDKMDTQPDGPMGETIPFTPEGGVMGGGSYLETRVRNVIWRDEY